MVFNSFDFMIFFPIVVIMYCIIPRRLRYVWLLAASYYFYMGWNPKYALLIALSTVITYAGGLLISVSENKNLRKMILFGSLISNLGILVIFKYANFFLENISRIMSNLGLGVIERRFDILLPVGISFYTFQALSYTIDVYYGKIRHEKNILRYALYVSFFPQLVAGPIERSANLLPQIQNVEGIKAWDFERIRDGLLLMFWGLFEKLVIADRISLLVDEVVNNYTEYGFTEIALAVFLFAFQIYCDFGGYTNIAIGAARVMGFDLMNNFRQPYFAAGIKDFWRRWHISLTSWFTDYLYIPLGGSRRGRLRKYINIAIVFAISGLWHGASWNYVAWGVLHAAYQIAEDLKGEVFTGKVSVGSFSGRIRKVVGTFILVDFAWAFFVCEDMSHALGLIRQAFGRFQYTDLETLGLSTENCYVLLFAFIILLIVDILHERHISIFGFVNRQETWFRWVLYLGLVWSTIIFGVYGEEYDASTFIYFQF